MTETGLDSSATPAHGRISAAGRWLLVAYALSGAAALIYEVAWMRVLGDILGSSAFASGTMLAAFMTGLGIGSLAGGILARRTTAPLRDASRAELGVGAASVIALLALIYLPPVFFDLLTKARVSSFGFLALQFAASFAVMLLPTIAMGFTYPLIMAAVGKPATFGRWAGLLYTSNTAGGIAGSLLAGYLLVPAIGIKGALAVAAGGSLVVAVVLGWLASRSEDAPVPWRSPELAIGALAVAAVLAMPAAPSFLLGVTSLNRFESASSFESVQKSAKTIYDRDSVYSRVSVQEYPDGTRTLRNGALVEGSNTDADKITPLLLSAIPMASSLSTGSVLVVGLGTGYTPAAALAVGTDHVTTVEINPGVVPAANFFAGRDLAADRRWRLVVDDARAHILTQHETYDVITSEPSWPISAAVAPLFTREFMAAARSRLNEGGVFCQWLPAYLMSGNDVAMMYKTMRQVFPRVDVWAVNQAGMAEGELILVGFRDGDPRTQMQIAQSIAGVVGQFGVAPDRFSVYSGAPYLEDSLSDPAIPLNTDDHTRLEYAVIWNLLEPSAPATGTVTK